MTGSNLRSRRAVWIRVDANGQSPLLISDDDEMVCAEGMEWRFVAEVESREQGRVLLEQLARERDAQAKVQPPSPRAAADRPPREDDSAT